ncbi:MAG: RNA polymerase sigma-70 factor, partial [Sediminibacterium sp.]
MFSLFLWAVKASEQYTDSELVQLWQQGDEQAFNALFGRYRNRLFHYLVKVTKSKENAEEATLDVFVKIWKAKSILHEVNHFEAFLFRVVHNQAIDYLRRARTSKMLQQELWESMEDIAAWESADHKLLKADAEAALQEAVSQLSPQRQEVFRLSREEYLTYDDIAERMHISKNTVRNHLSAALQFIRGHLDNGP